MNIKCGVDIIEIERIRESIKKTNGKFASKIFTNNEIEYCESKKGNRYQHYAARFAAKEAIFKAISEELTNKSDVNWQDVEIVCNSSGRPEITFLNYKLKNRISSSDVSLSHSKELAIANVIIVFKGE